MTNFNLFVNLITGAFSQIFIIGLFATAIFNKKRRNYSFSQKIVGFVVLSLLNFSTFFIFDFFWYSKNNLTPIPGFIQGILLCIIMPLVLCKIKIYWAVLGGAGIFIIRSLAELAVTAIVIIPRGLTLVNAELLDISIILQFFAIYLLLAFLIYKYILWIKKGSSKNIPRKLIPILVFTILTFHLMYIKGFFEVVGAEYVINSISTEANTLTLYLSLVLIIIFIFLQTRSIIQHREKEKELKTIEEQLAMQKEYIIQMVQKQEQIQLMAHDFKQHIHTLKGLSNSGNLQKVSEILQKLSEQQLNSAKIIFTGNVMLDALLSIKREIAEKENISCDWNIATPPRLPIKELDTCVILGNALDNAIEACRKSQNENQNEKPYIKLNLELESDWLLCGITNPIGQPPKIVKGIFKTLKSDYDLHGFGLQSIKQCCESMGGNMEVYHDEKIFTVRFMLPLNVE